MKKFDLSAIMCKAWKLYRKGVGSFSEALHRAWNSAKAAPINAQRIEEASRRLLDTLFPPTADAVDG